ncbi:MAG: hypothetical protein ACM3O7_12015 [Acidobacteriota bacterium]
MSRNTLRLLVAAATLTWAAASAHAAEPALTKCHMTFALKGWSAIYKTAHGRGTITCTNGQRLPVTLAVHGGGLTFGKMDVLEGKGEFSGARSIQEVLGSYAAAEAAAGAVKSGEAAVYTKGEISLALAGTGRGVGVGFDFGRLDIERARR